VNESEFTRLVADMRTNQRTYFRSRSASALQAATAMERRVDEEIRRRLPTDGYRQLDIFDRGPGPGGGAA
jgi:hypothetical protein